MDEQVRARLVAVAAEAIARARFEHHRFDDPPEGVLAEAVIDALRIEPAGVGGRPHPIDGTLDSAWPVFRLSVLSLPPKETAP